MMMKSQVSLVIVATMLLVLISYHQTGEAAPAHPTAAVAEGAPHRVKRSFCNTYGGCSSSKRSIQQQQAAAGTFGGPGPSDTVAESILSANEMAKKDIKAGLVAEILGDLIEYLQTDEKYRQGKYVVMVPGVDSRNSLSTSNNQGDIGWLSVKREE